MVDAATQVLMMRGISGAGIFADRFLTRGAPAAASIESLERTKKSRSDQATVLDYMKFLLFQALALATAVAIMAGKFSPRSVFWVSSLAMCWAIWLRAMTCQRHNTTSPLS
jgi:hypothetical protein